MIAILRHVQIRLGKVNKTDDLVSENCVIGFIEHMFNDYPWHTIRKICVRDFL